MRQLKYIHAVLAVLASWALVSCTIDERYPVVGECESVVTFTPVLSGDMQTRAIGDATKINQLLVAVYERIGDTRKHRFTSEYDWNVAQSRLQLILIEGRTYDILFWAQCKCIDNTPYTLSDAGQIQVNYTNYLAGGFAKMEELDAFYATSSVTVGSSAVEDKGSITLVRPLAQVNFADNATAPVPGEHQSVVTFQNYPTSFDPFTGSVGVSSTTDELVFTFTDFPDDPLSSGGVEYHYLSCNYFFAMTDSPLSATLEFQTADGSTTIETVSVQEVPLEPNHKTNVIGSIVREPETWSVWDGDKKTEPALDAQNRYVIDEASDLAWLAVAENVQTLESNRTFILTKDLDMAQKDGLASINLPSGSTVEGGEHTIQGVRLGGALFGEATNLTVKNLNLEDVVVAGSQTHAGILVNILKGSSTFNNVTISNSSVKTTNGAAGGMVGYIVRTTEKDRAETLNVSFTGCTLNIVTVTGSESEGKFVGLLSGYDNSESLSFDEECVATDVTVTDYTSVYVEANNSAWADDVNAKYDGWLGHETYRRAKVTFGGKRLAPRWDGTTVTAIADLLLYNGGSNKYEVHSPFDLAGVRNATPSPAALYLMENVDMFGQGADGKYNVPSNWTQSAYGSEDDNYFKSFSTIAYLDGNSYGIYNLNINTQKVSTTLYYGGFIQSTSGTTTHKNISFYNSCVVVPHVVYKNEDKGSAGMLVSNIDGDSYTMQNVHTYSCKIFALQKVGGIAARVAATSSSISNCSVNDCYIENYKCEQNLETFSGGNNWASVSTTFYSYGEIGGMFGFVEKNTTIDNCQVKGTEIYAFGQDDKAATKSGLASILRSYYTVPGRHVGTFIGDIRTTTAGGGTITMTNISVDSNTKCINRWDKHNNKCETVGRAYFLYLKDDEGTVKYNGTKLKLQNCKNNQDRNQ